MATAATIRSAAHSPRFTAWLPLLVLPITVALMGFSWPPWVFMWGLAGSIYAGLKWLTFANFPITVESSVRRSLAYLLLWPGMDAKSFLATSRSVGKPGRWEWPIAMAKTLFGVFLIAIAAHFADDNSLIAGWIGMAGIIFMLHFGLFHLLSVIWRRAGIDAPTIMDAPVLASDNHVESRLSRADGRFHLHHRDLRLGRVLAGVDSVSHGYGVSANDFPVVIPFQTLTERNGGNE